MKIIKIAVIVVAVFGMALCTNGASLAQDDGGDGGGDVGSDGGGDAVDVGTEVSDAGEAVDMSESGQEQAEMSDTADLSEEEDIQAENNDVADVPEEEQEEVMETSESYEEYPAGTVSNIGSGRRGKGATGVTVIGATTKPAVKTAGKKILSRTSFVNKKVSDALADGKIKIGMTKEELINQIGYPPNSSVGQDKLFYQFTQSNMTAAGKEESWTYYIGATNAGMKNVTFKIVDGKVVAWDEWLDRKGR